MTRLRFLMFRNLPPRIVFDGRRSSSPYPGAEPKAAPQDSETGNGGKSEELVHLLQNDWVRQRLLVWSEARLRRTGFSWFVNLGRRFALP